MFITTPNEIINLMPTARWNEPQKLFGYLEEEERVALEPLLGTPLYQKLGKEYERLLDTYVDITSATIKPTHRAKAEPALPYADVTERMNAMQAGQRPYDQPCVPTGDETEKVDEKDMMTIRLLRICQQIEFYKMIAHKAGLLNVSFNDGGGMNRVSADGYDPADIKEIEHVVKDAFMSAGRAVDSLLLFLEADAKDGRLFTELWQEADAFYLHKNLLFQTARVLNEYLDIKNERMAYVQLVRDIRFCQNTYLKTRIGGKLLRAVVDYANKGYEDPENGKAVENETYDDLLDKLRTALAFYVESRRQDIGSKQEKLARRDSMTDAQQALADACQFIETHLDDLGEAAVDTPIYNAVHAREAQEKYDREHAEEAAARRRAVACHQQSRKLFTAFPHTARQVDTK
jgi:hypothetical protein